MTERRQENLVVVLDLYLTRKPDSVINLKTFLSGENFIILLATIIEHTLLIKYLIISLLLKITAKTGTKAFWTTTMTVKFAQHPVPGQLLNLAEEPGVRTRDLSPNKRNKHTSILPVFFVKT